MEKQVQFRDRQELQAGDLSNIGIFAGESFDRLVREGMTNEKKYSGFSIVKTGATQATVATGTYWTNGERYIRETSTVLEFLSQLPLVTKKIAAVIATGAETDTDIEPRDYLINVDTGATEPDSVAMQKLRLASFQLAYGTENATPQKPTVSADNLVIGWVTLNTTGVESIEMAAGNEFMSLKRLDQRATELEVWKGQAGEQITTLATDITSLNSRLLESADSSVLVRIFSDVAAIKARLELETGFSGYGADNYLAYAQSNSDNTQVSYYAKVEEGIRFADANATEVSIQLFNPLDSSVKVASNGLCLPDYTEVRRLSVDAYFQQLSLSQYQFQTHTYKTNAMSAVRLRFGLAFTVCNNSEFWRTGSFDYSTGIFTDTLGRTYQALDTDFGSLYGRDSVKFLRLQQFWYDTETTYYQERVTTNFSISGSMVAQTFLNSQGGWLTSIDLFFTQVGTTGDVTVLITETDGGKPDLNKVISRTTLPVANIVRGTNATVASQWTRIPLTPTALLAGGRYGIVLITGGNHFVGQAQGATYAAGTLFYSTDGAFLQGDLTLDMMFRANFASFKNTRIEVDLASINLSGGINDIDIAFEGISPDGTKLQFEIRPQGSPTWFPVTETFDGNPFAGLPALCSFRAVFLGTKDLMPGFRLTNSKVKVSRPAVTMTHFTEAIPLPAPTRSIKVIALIDQYREANHDLSCALIDVTNANAVRTAATITDEVLDDRGGSRFRIRRTFTFNTTSLPVNTSNIRIRTTGAALAATEVFHVERLTYLSF